MPESIHHKAQWSSVARGVHGGMISKPLCGRETGRVKKKPHTHREREREHQGEFPVFTALVRLGRVSTLHSSRAISATDRLILLNNNRCHSKKPEPKKNNLGKLRKIN